MPSEPVALLGLILRINVRISSFPILNWSILFSVRMLGIGITLLLIIGLHCCEKKSLEVGFLSAVQNKPIVYNRVPTGLETSGNVWILRCQINFCLEMSGNLDTCLS